MGVGVGVGGHVQRNSRCSRAEKARGAQAKLADTLKYWSFVLEYSAMPTLSIWYKHMRRCPAAQYAALDEGHRPSDTVNRVPSKASPHFKVCHDVPKGPRQAPPKAERSRGHAAL